MRILPLVAAVGLVVLGLLGPVAPPAHADDAQRAKELFQEGTRYFDLGHFDKAIDAWQQGYRQKADPVFLYNIAQAYRLAGDANKAIFFYRGYLRNSPKAHNRPEVEQKIQQLQKQVADEQPAKPGSRPTAPATAATPEASGEPSRSRAAPPQAPPTAPPAAPPPSGTPGAPSPPAPPGPAPRTPPAPPAGSPAGASDPYGYVPPPVVAAPAPAPAAAVLRPLDFGVGIGLDGWSSGVQGKADASFALMVTAGYALGHDPAAPVRFRLGGSFGYTFLKEAASKDTFLSLLVVPTLLIRAGARVGFFGELGFGIVGISGLVPSSGLLDHKQTLKINGTQSLLEIRPALGLQIQLSPGVGLFVSGAVDYSPKGAHFYQPISRTELLLGLSLRR